MKGYRYITKVERLSNCCSSSWSVDSGVYICEEQDLATDTALSVSLHRSLRVHAVQDKIYAIEVWGETPHVHELSEL